MLIFQSILAEGIIISLKYENLILQIYDFYDTYLGDGEPFRDEYKIGKIEFTNFMEKIYFDFELKELI